MGQCPRRSPRGCLLLQQCLDRTDPGTPLLPAPCPPSDLLSKHRLQSHLSRPSSASETSQHQFSDLNSSLPSNHKPPGSSALFHSGGGCQQPPGHPASAGPLHLPRSGLLAWPQRCGPAGPGPLLLRAGRVETRGLPASLKDAKPVLSGLFSSSGRRRSLPKTSGVTLRTHGSHHGPGEEPDPSPLGPACPGLCPHTPSAL